MQDDKVCIYNTLPLDGGGLQSVPGEGLDINAMEGNMKKVLYGFMFASLLVSSLVLAEDINGKLLIAINQGDTVKAKEMLDKGADPNFKNDIGFPLLNLSVQFNYTDSVKLLLGKGATVDFRDHYGWTELMLASNRGNVEIIKLLLDNGADVNAKSKIGETPLILAVARGHSKVVRLLVARGADLKASFNGKKLMEIAEALGPERKDEIIKILKEAAAKKK